MVYIYHGANQTQSRLAFSQHLDKCVTSEVIRVDSKEVNLENITLFLRSPSLFSKQKTLAISNFFSLPKPAQDKIIKLVDKTDLVLWQDKSLTATQLKTFPQAKNQIFRLPSPLYTCLNAIQPKNLTIFLPLFRQIVKLNLFDPFLYLLKGHLRRQLAAYSKFPPEQLKLTYLRLIELEYQYKSGQLASPPDIALEKIIIALIS